MISMSSIIIKGSVLQNGKYRIEGLLGQGGFGTTYSAIQTGLNRKVAIKEFFMKELCDRDETTLTVSVPSSGSRELVDKFKAKFIKEAQMISEFKHPNIVSIYDIFEENGTAYYVMEYHDGGSLSSLSLPLPVAEAVRYIRQVASALSYLHKRNIMHLDVKPANVLIDGEGNAVLIDFGISKRYDESGGQTSSTPVGVSNGYAPIEQYSQAVSKFTPATDAYSLGATFYKLLTGNTPPDASLLVCEPESLVIPSSMPSCFAELIRKCLKPNVSGRPQSIDEFISVLDGYVAQPAPETKQDKKGVEPDVADDETVMPTVNPVNVKKVSSRPHAPKKSPASSATTSQKKSSRPWLWVALIAGVLAVGAVGFMMLKSGEGQTGDSAFVQHTREVYERVINARTSDEFREALIEVGNWIESLSAEEQRRVQEIAGQYKYAIEAQYDKFPQQGSYNYQEWVDLCLPSGLKWAKCNMGASESSYSGGYSRIEPISVCDSTGVYSDMGSEINDIATTYWGGGWRMPTAEEFQELIDYCEWTWMTEGYDLPGYEVRGRNGYSIFLPAAGSICGDNGSVSDCRSTGAYWSSTPCERQNYAYNLSFSEYGCGIDHNYRYFAMPVRPVVDEEFVQE